MQQRGASIACRSATNRHGTAACKQAARRQCAAGRHTGSSSSSSRHAHVGDGLLLLLQVAESHLLALLHNGCRQRAWHRCWVSHGQGRRHGACCGCCCCCCRRRTIAAFAPKSAQAAWACTEPAQCWRRRAPGTLSASGCTALSTSINPCFTVPSLYCFSTSCGQQHKAAPPWVKASTQQQRRHAQLHGTAAPFGAAHPLPNPHANVCSTQRMRARAREQMR